ncbi:MAG: carbon-nitrogen hydrolase family protein [Anaerolineales bacterium]|nr:carbon-nitrogen hydrolase family protein [Anaerolineales bacterium]
MTEKIIDANSSDNLTIGLAQIAPVWLDRAATLAKIATCIGEAAENGCHLVVFGEALLPGYPFWVERTEGARFNSQIQKEIHLDQAVQIEAGHLDQVCALAAANQMAVYLGIIERPLDRGGHSLYCSLVYINAEGEIGSMHRKLMPTYEERLVWSIGDGHGLWVHSLRSFTVGGLNCWENWMPLPRSVLYAQGEDLHVAVWPGSYRNTHDITRFIAKESRSYVVSVSGLMRKTDFPPDTPHLNLIIDNSEDVLANGGSCLAGPDGEWLVEPVVDEEALTVATIDHARIREERQNFDPSGHYSRPDVTRLVVNRQRQRIIDLED